MTDLSRSTSTVNNESGIHTLSRNSIVLTQELRTARPPRPNSRPNSRIHSSRYVKSHPSASLANLFQKVWPTSETVTKTNSTKTFERILHFLGNFQVKGFVGLWSWLTTLDFIIFSTAIVNIALFKRWNFNGNFLQQCSCFVFTEHSHFLQNVLWLSRVKFRTTAVVP